MSYCLTLLTKTCHCCCQQLQCRNRWLSLSECLSCPLVITDVSNALKSIETLVKVYQSYVTYRNPWPTGCTCVFILPQNINKTKIHATKQILDIKMYSNFLYVSGPTTGTAVNISENYWSYGSFKSLRTLSGYTHRPWELKDDALRRWDKTQFRRVYDSRHLSK